MVKLTKIYTRSGDSGTTGLGSGERVPKSSPRVEAYGTVDEANAFLGVAVVTARQSHPELAETLETLQHDLFDLGADLCTPVSKDEAPDAALRITASRVKQLEDLIDEHNRDIGPLNSFVLPGGCRLAAELHVARTVCRRAERGVARLIELEPEATSGLTMQYLNRLSDLLFVLSRFANGLGKDDVLWVPGKNRS
ncbi:MAG: cob(I)yrinic acid a,c-diamide adenosyltransferase [Phycisphaerales bacterium]